MTSTINSLHGNLPSSLSSLSSSWPSLRSSLSLLYLCYNYNGCDRHNGRYRSSIRIPCTGHLKASTMKRRLNANLSQISLNLHPLLSQFTPNRLPDRTTTLASRSTNPLFFPLITSTTALPASTLTH